MANEFYIDTESTETESLSSGDAWLPPEKNVSLDINDDTGTGPRKETENVVIGGYKIVKKDIDTLVALANQTEAKFKHQQEQDLFYIHVMIKKAPFPTRWKSDGVASPNSNCRELTFKYASDVYNKGGIIPYRVSCSIEEGMMLTYWNENNRKILRIEVYNTNEIVGSVSQGSEILSCSDINVTDIGQLLKLFVVS